MDRFIEKHNSHCPPAESHLKSNMDRFIGILKLYNDKTILKFKIQYG